jgi:glycosyltransferase involved in cell wall biosynthesis
MKLSIITINRNNAAGLEKTLQSVASQTFKEFEYIIVDGASTDGSVEVIKKNESQFAHLKWVSEPDSGIYNAMNKGICMATGDYIQILNSADILAASNVTECMIVALKESEYKGQGAEVSLLYGNMIKKDYSSGKIVGKSGKVEYSLRQYYSSTMNHDCCYIRRDLFDAYGLYDENLKIVSDWKWFLQVIGLGRVKPVYVDIDVTVFDTSGISERNLDIRNKERRQVLEEVLPPAILTDYDAHAFPVSQYQRLKRYHLWPIVHFIERLLFKLNKWHVLK